MTTTRLAAALLIIAVTACSSPGATSTPNPSPVPTVTAGPTQTASPPASTQSATWEPTAAPSEDLAWQRIDALPGAADGSAAVSVTAGDPGFVAVGISGISPTGREDAAVWTSADGREWTRVAGGDAFAFASMADVVASDGMLVAVGRDNTSPDQAIALSWASPDGMVWQRADTQAQFDQLEGTQMIGVTAGGPGFVAVGSAPAMDASAAWTSTDGLAWQRVPHGPVFETSFMWSVIAGGPGFVAVGWEGRPELRAAAVWTSPDGLEWTLAEPLPGGEAFQARSVAEGANGTLVAVGDSIGGGQSAIWTSEDGVTWTAAGDPAMFEETLVSSVVAFRDGFLAAGSIAADGLGVDAALWTSPDGEEWTLQDPEAFSGAYIAGLVAADNGAVVAVGASQQPIEGTGSVVQAAIAWYAE